MRADRHPPGAGGAQLLRVFCPLHVGAMGGIVAKWLCAVLGLARAVRLVTALLIWYTRWRRAAPQATEREEVRTRPVEGASRMATIRGGLVPDPRL